MYLLCTCFPLPHSLSPLKQAPLRPYSYPANLDIWSFYLDNFLSQFPPYDTELISEGELTLLDMHHNFFEKEKTLTQMGVPIDTPGPAMNVITTLLRRYTGQRVESFLALDDRPSIISPFPVPAAGLMNSLATRKGHPLATWIELWEELQGSTDNSQPLMPVSLSLALRPCEGQPGNETACLRCP